MFFVTLCWVQILTEGKINGEKKSGRKGNAQAGNVYFCLISHLVIRTFNLIYVSG